MDTGRLPISLIVVLFLISVHLRVEEKITLTAGREGGLQNLEVHGLVTLKITNEKCGRIKVVIRNGDTKGAQLQVGNFLKILLTSRYSKYDLAKMSAS